MTVAKIWNNIILLQECIKLDRKTWLWWKIKYSSWQAQIFNSSWWGRWSSPQARLLNPLLVIRLLPALSHNGSVIWEPCSPPAMLCPHWWMHWSEPLFSLFLQRGSDELFSSCISNGPYIMNPGRGGVAMEGWILFIEVLVVAVLFALPWRSIHYSRRTRAFCSLPDCICFCVFFFPAANGNDSKKFKGDVRSPGVPSRVVHVRKLPNDINEAEVIGLGLPFGKVTNLLMLKGKNQVRTDICRSAHQTCMTYTPGWN